MNKCGDCNVCCNILAVKGLKDARTDCKYKCVNGCSIYESRPNACAHFECVWLTRGWKKEFRPDKSGVMLAAYKDRTEVYRLQDNVNELLMEVIFKNKNIVGIDARASL